MIPSQNMAQGNGWRSRLSQRGPLSGSFLGDGDVELKEILGKGGMGVVYRGRQVVLDREVAVKMLLFQNLPERERQDAANRLHDEARAAARIRHKNLVEIISMGVDESHGPYIVYEYLPGSTLKDKVEKDGPMEWKTFYEKVGRGLLQALGELHKVGVIHRDVKPENVLQSANGSYKLGDLGLALFQGRSANTIAGTLYGTPGYLAPERVCDESGQLGTGSDLYSAAVLMVEAVTGSLPFHGRSSVEIISDQLKRKVDGKSLAGRGLPREVSRVLARALSRNPQRRPKTAAQFIELLDEATFDEKKNSPRLTKPAPVEERNGKQSFAIGAFVLFLLLVLFSRHPYFFKEEKARQRLGPEFQKLRQEAIDGKVGSDLVGGMVLQSELGQRLGLPEETSEKTAGFLYLARFCHDKKNFGKALEFYLQLGQCEQRVLSLPQILELAVQCARAGKEWKQLTRLLPRLQKDGLSSKEASLLRLRMAQSLIERYICETHGQRLKKGRTKLDVSVETLHEALDILHTCSNCGQDLLVFQLQLTVLAFQTRESDKGELVDLVSKIIKNETLPQNEVNELVRKAVFILSYAYMPAEEDMKRNVAWLEELLQKSSNEDEKALLLAYKSAMLIKSLTDLGKPTEERAVSALQVAKEALALAKEPKTRAYGATTKAWILARMKKNKEAWQCLESVRRKDVDEKDLWWYLRVKGGLEAYDNDYQKALSTHVRAVDCAPPELTHYIRLVHAGSVAAAAGLFVPGQ